LVASLSAKKSLSTLDKSRVDWDVSKEEVGDSAELEAAAKGKDSYTQRMQFLAQTDARQFELEKAARDVQRREAARKAANNNKASLLEESEPAYARQSNEERDADALVVSAPPEESKASDAPQ
jgi:hypothetical protein